MSTVKSAHGQSCDFDKFHVATHVECVVRSVRLFLRVHRYTVSLIMQISLDRPGR